MPDGTAGPLDLTAMLALSEGVVFAERCALNSVKGIRAAKKAMRKAAPRPDRRIGLFHCGIAVTLPHQLEDDPGAILEVDR